MPSENIAYIYMDNPTNKKHYEVILAKTGLFNDLKYFSVKQSNADLWSKLKKEFESSNFVYMFFDLATYKNQRENVQDFYLSHGGHESQLICGLLVENIDDARIATRDYLWDKDFIYNAPYYSALMKIELDTVRANITSRQNIHAAVARVFNSLREKDYQTFTKTVVDGCEKKITLDFLLYMIEQQKHLVGDVSVNKYLGREELRNPAVLRKLSNHLIDSGFNQEAVSILNKIRDKYGLSSEEFCDLIHLKVKMYDFVSWDICYSLYKQFINSGSNVKKYFKSFTHVVLKYYFSNTDLNSFYDVAGKFAKVCEHYEYYDFFEKFLLNSFLEGVDLKAYDLDRLYENFIRIGLEKSSYEFISMLELVQRGDMQSFTIFCRSMKNIKNKKKLLETLKERKVLSKSEQQIFNYLQQES